MFVLIMPQEEEVAVPPPLPTLVFPLTIEPDKLAVVVAVRTI
jgi:hypothetical protein